MHGTQSPIAAPCTHCGANTPSKRLEGARGAVLTCGACGGRYLADWGQSYSEALYDYYGDPEWLALASAYDPLTEQRYVALLDAFARRVPGRSVLDVGCGVGHFVHTASQRGWNARGIELSSAAVNFCQSHGVPVTQTDLFSAELEANSWDVCTLFEVLEHLPEPQAFLARTVELTRPGGLVYVTVPNIASLDARVQGRDWTAINPEHLSYFTPQTLGRLLRGAGLKPLDMTSRNVSGMTLRKLVGRSAPPPALETASVAEALAPYHADQRLRARIEGSPVLRAAKATVNGVLGAFGLGSALVALSVKPT
ncbi:MAG TPA: methyltransferase domain-containing protein [Caulobacteraceae bacterium]|jgi:SAM-dependent methyltransferase|nr:methyltransferase domain-containing protein [Caulobacteraceae bacterium]